MGGEQFRVTVAGRDAAHGAAVCNQDADFDAAAEVSLLDVVPV
jgi:hypothetical protein